MMTMQGMIISNPRLEFLRPVLERWFDCIDRYNAVRGDSDTLTGMTRKPISECSRPQPGWLSWSL